jgi:NTE family protein
MFSLSLAALSLAGLSLLALAPVALGGGIAELAPARPKTCLVLSGGGARGAAHIGVIRLLEEMRIPIDCVVGTSMGAIVGASWVSGRSPAEMERAMRTADWDVVLGDEPDRPQRSWLSKDLERERVVGAEIGMGRKGALLPGGAVIGQQLERFLPELLGPPVNRRSFDELSIPFRAIATDIETGRMKILEAGILNAAVRASMSVPGAFAPQEIDGRLYVDGGLVRNLGVDVARGLGAERVIAVNLGSTLAGRDEVNSLVGVTAQVINILTDQNVNASLAELQSGDVLIQPILGNFSAANFREAAAIIGRGEDAARTVSDRLRELSVDEPTWQAWRARTVEASAAPRALAAVEVRTENLRFVNPERITAVLDEIRAKSTETAFVDRAVDALYATDDFQRVTLRTESLPAGNVVIIEPREKSWSPNYLRFGTTLTTNLEGESGFSVFADLRATWLNDQGLESRTRVSLGEVMSLRTELLQPLERRQRWIAGAFLDASERIDTLFLDEQPFTRFSNTVVRSGLELRSRDQTDKEWRLGLQRSWYDLRRESSVSFAPVRTHATTAFLRFTYDRLDDWDFPRRGLYASMKFE